MTYGIRICFTLSCYTKLFLHVETRRKPLLALGAYQKFHCCMCYHFCRFFKSTTGENQCLHLAPSSAIFFDLCSFDFLILHCKQIADGNHLFSCWSFFLKKCLQWPFSYLHEAQGLLSPMEGKEHPKACMHQSWTSGLRAHSEPSFQACVPQFRI